MNSQDYYFTLMPCNNGWLVKQYEWVKAERFDVTYTLVFDNLNEAIERLNKLANNPMSFIKAYE